MVVSLIAKQHKRSFYAALNQFDSRQERVLRMTALIAEFEVQTGLAFDTNGPVPIACEHCGRLLQYIPNHECHGIQGEAQEARHGGFGEIEE